MSSSVKKISKSVFRVEVEHEGRVYTDVVGPEGLKSLLDGLSKDDQYYLIAEKMLKAIEKVNKKQSRKTEGGSNEVDQQG